MTLQTLLNDEQKAFEKDFPYCDSDFCYCWKKETQDKQKAFLALHDQKIITAVIGGIEKKMDEWMAVTDVDNPLSVKDIKDELLADLQHFIRELINKKV